MNRFVQTVCIVGAVALGVLVTRLFGQVIGLPPVGESICYTHCEMVACNSTTLQGGSCYCVGKTEAQCNGTASQHRGQGTTSNTAKAYGGTQANWYVNTITPTNCGFREQREADCVWDMTNQYCACVSDNPWTVTAIAYRRLGCFECDPL